MSSSVKSFACATEESDPDILFLLQSNPLFDALVTRLSLQRSGLYGTCEEGSWPAGSKQPSLVEMKPTLAENVVLPRPQLDSTAPCRPKALCGSPPQVYVKGQVVL